MDDGYEELVALYGEPFQYSDYKIGQHIRYPVEGLGVLSGEIVWVAAPQEVAGKHVPVHYIVAPDRGGFFDIVYHVEAIGIAPTPKPTHDEPGGAFDPGIPYDLPMWYDDGDTPSQLE